MRYELIKVYNNSAILVKTTDNQQEAILVGKGIGFNKTVGQFYSVDKEQIEKHFLTYDDLLKQEYYTLLNGIEEAIFTTVLEIMEIAQQRLGPLNPRAPLVLADHIAFAIERMKTNQEIFNPFVDELKILYPEEFEIALLAQLYLKNNLKIVVSEDEVGFIALHLYAARKQIKVSESVKGTRLIKELIDIIEKHLSQPIKRDLDFSRLLYHLRSTVERSIEKKTVKNPLNEQLKTELKESYQIAQLLKEKIEQQLQTEVVEDEVGFMAIHIYRLMQSQQTG